MGSTALSHRLHGSMVERPHAVPAVVGWIPAPDCIKNALDLPDDSDQSALTLPLFLMVILASQV